MKIDILTLFPNSFDFLKSYGVIGKAVENNLININTVDIRTFSKDKHNKVDDEVYGGQGNVKHMTYHAKQFDEQWYVELYLPARTAVILKEVPAPVKKRPGRPKKVKTEETEKPKKVSKPRKKKTEA